jgi:hypothetical protein
MIKSDSFISKSIFFITFDAFTFSCKAILGTPFGADLGAERFQTFQELRVKNNFRNCF